MVDTKQLKARIEYEMKLRGLTPKEMSQMLGISLSTWYWRMSHLEKIRLEELRYVERTLHTDLVTTTSVA